MSNSKKTILLSALCVAVAILTLGYSAYGWMSMSREVRAIGQNISITVPENLMISTSLDGPWSDTVNVDMKSLVKALTANDEKKFTDSDSFYLLPASTYSGIDGTIWQTGNAKTDGSYADGAVFSAGNCIKWNASTSSFEGHYIDVPLYFRTDGDVDPNLQIALAESATSIEPAGENGNKIENAVRVAFLNSECNAPSTGSEPLVLASKNSTGLHGGVIKSVSGNTITEYTPKYLEFNEGGKTSQLFSVTTGAVTQITVRIWVEGQDRSCIAMIGGQTFSVSLGFCVIENN